MSQHACYGRRFFQVALLLPLAMPAYIIAYTYTGVLDPAQGTWWSQAVATVGDIRSLPGAIVMLALVLFPYVYVLSYHAFAEHQVRFAEVSQTLGLSRSQYFWRVAMPLARPAIFAGAALAMMEALADYGTVAYFGVNTLTTGIFRVWFGMGERAFAGQLASLLATLVLIVLLLEQHSRRKMRFYQSPKSQAVQRHVVVAVHKKIVTTVYLSVVCLLGFILPAAMLTWWSVDFWSRTDWAEYVNLLRNTLGLAGLSAVVIVALALVFSYTQRWFQRSRFRYMAQFIGLGYALPGVVVAVGIMWPLGWLDMQLNLLWHMWQGEYIGLLFSGTVFALVFAYAVRFINVANNNVFTGLQRISPSYDDAVLSLGKHAWHVVSQVHWPMLKPALFSALVLVFVDVLKELPATLILRPFNFNTFAVKAFEYASDEQLLAAALPALSIVVVGILPLMLLLKHVYKESN
jgi:iron(III) transport system permease protein